MPDSITIPAPYIGMADAKLVVEPDQYGDSYTMTLWASDDSIIAQASGFRPGAATDFGEGHERETADTFGAFLGAALEDPEFGASWEVLSDDASDWTDALQMYGDIDGQIEALRTEIAEAYRLGRDPQRQLCELADLEEEAGR